MNAFAAPAAHPGSPAGDPPGTPACDVVFALEATRLPAHPAQPLWESLVEALPWLGSEPGAGVHPLRGLSTDGELLVTKRTRLTLRLPLSRHEDALQLCGRELHLGDAWLQVGAAQVRPLAAQPTLSAWFVVTGAGDELSHQQAVQRELEQAGLPTRFVCGTLRSLGAGALRLRGGQVVLYELRPEQSLGVQQQGLGGWRHLGAGLFVAHKTISGID